jgi:ferredoxin
VIVVDPDVCVSHGECVREAPGTFEWSTDGLGQVRPAPTDGEETVIEAALRCPSGAISVTAADTGEDLLG